MAMRVIRRDCIPVGEGRGASAFRYLYCPAIRGGRFRRRVVATYGDRVDNGRTLMAPQGSSDPRANNKCKHCGGWHGGVQAPDVCPECWSKGKR